MPAPPRAAVRGPGLQPVHGRHRVGQVGLQHDARFQAGKLSAVEDRHEHCDGQVEVAVFLHVQVDELGRRRPSGQPVKRYEASSYMADRLVEGPWRKGRHGGRYLYRHVVDVRSHQELSRPLKTRIGLPLPQHSLAEEVEIEPGPRCAGTGDSAAEPGVGGVDEKVAHHRSQSGAYDVHHGAPGRRLLASRRREGRAGGTTTRIAAGAQPTRASWPRRPGHLLGGPPGPRTQP